MLLAVVLCLSFALPVAAAPGKGNVVDQDSEAETLVDEYYDGPYLITEVVHFNGHYTEYANGSTKEYVQYRYIFNVTLDGATIYHYADTERISWNDNPGSGSIVHEAYLEMEAGGGYKSSWHVVYSYSNGVIHVDFTKVT
jgi:hypothetical protein